MPWIRVDDHFSEHPKLAAAGPLAWALWFAGLGYCNRNLTDGFIPWAVADRLVSWDFLDPDGPVRIYIGNRDRVSEDGIVTSEYVIMLMLDRGLWEAVDGGYQVHDYSDYQPTKAVVTAERAKKAASGSAGGIATATARARATAVAQSKPVPNPNPVPVSVVPNTVPSRENAMNESKPPRPSAVDKSPLMAEMRDAIRERYGDGMDEPGVTPKGWKRTPEGHPIIPERTS